MAIFKEYLDAKDKRKRYRKNTDGTYSEITQRINRGKKYRKNSDGTFSLITDGPVREESTTSKSTVSGGGNKDGWFKAGGFSDGVDGVGDFIGDLGETVAGTLGDAGVGILKGATRLGEGVLDLTRYGVAGISEKLGNTEYAEQQRKWAMEDSTTNLYAPLSDYVDQYSILGDRADAVTEGIGQVGALILTGGVLGAAGAGAGAITAATTGAIGASSMGSGMSEAYLNNATDEEALTYGAIAGLTEASTELLFGGMGKAAGALGLSKGILPFDDMLAKKVSGKLSSQVSKNLAEYGIKAGAEGFEEVLSSIGQAWGKSVTYSEKDMKEIVQDENLLDQFIVGAVTSGIMQSGYVPGTKQGSLREANETGRDFITGFSENEQKVIDAEVESRIAEKEKDGNKLSKKEKGKVQKEVEEQLKKGYIGTDRIEEILGDSAYTEYKAISDKESTLKDKETALLEEVAALQEKENRTTEETERYIEASKELKEVRNELSALDSRTAKKMLSDKVDSLTENDTFIRESYNENTRRGQAFTADTSQYNEKSQEVVQKAVDSGILNNTRKTHDFVEMVAKISADTGVSFDFTNNQKLKESGFAIEGRTVNGLVENGNIKLNVNSAKALETVVGHEITHVLEGTELYGKLQEAVKQYATTKGVYDTKLNEVLELYTKKDADGKTVGIVDGVDINGEVTADLIGEYIFSDADFVRHLSAEKPNLFKKIYNEIKYLVKVATAGSKEARELLKVQKVFEEAYRESGKSSDSGVKFSLMQFSDDGRRYVEIDQEQEKFEGHDRSEYPQIAKEIINEKFNGKIIGIDNKMFVNGQGRNEFINPVKHIEGDIYEAKMRAAGELDNLLDAGMNFRNEPDGKDGHVHPDVIDGFDYFDTLFKIGDNYYEAVINIKNVKRGKLFKDVTKIKDVTQDIMSSYGKNPKSQFLRTSSMNNIPQSIENATENTKFSLSKDSQGRSLTEAQQEYFKDSKVVDDNGNLKVMYHGTANDFTIFDTSIAGGKNGTAEGYGLYFADTTEVSDAYGGKLMTGYLNIKRPATSYEKTINRNELAKLIKVTAEAEAKKLVEDGEYDDFSDALKDSWVSNYVYTYDMTMEEAYNEVAEQILFQNYDDMAIVQEVMNGNAICDYETAYKFYDILKDVTGIDGFMTEWDNPSFSEKSQIVLAFDSNQFKDINNQNPTDNPDINLSLSSTQSNIAPINPNLTYGKDIALEDIKKTEEVETIDLSKVDDLSKRVNGLHGSQKYKEIQSYILDVLSEQPVKLNDGIEAVVDRSDALHIANKSASKKTAQISKIKELIELAFPYAEDIKTEHKKFDYFRYYKVNVRFGKETFPIYLNVGRAKNDGKYHIYDITNKIRDTADLISGLERPKPNEGYAQKNVISNLIVPNSTENATSFSQNVNEIRPPEDKSNTSIKESNRLKLHNLENALAKNQKDARDSHNSFNAQIAEVQREYESKKNKDTKVANALLQKMNRLKTQRDNIQVEYERKANRIKERMERMGTEEYSRQEQRKSKDRERGERIRNLIGDTSTWRDKKVGVFYQVNTLRRNLRDIVRDAKGNKDIAKADAIYEELQGKYNRNEAKLNREAAQLKKVFFDMDINRYEDAYIQMLGEKKYNPDCSISDETMAEYLKKYKKKMDLRKVDKAIEMARPLYDSLFERVNAVLREEGMKEIGYRQGYFPHFTEEKQGLLAKLLNWKSTKNEDIPTDIAGITETFNPVRTYQSFDKHRTGDSTDYSFLKGLDTYVQGALDWIYHIGDIKNRRALEHEIRYSHSEAGVKEKIDAIMENTSLEEEEREALIDSVYAEAGNPLGNFLIDFRNGTNNLAGKKSTADRSLEYSTNRQIYGTMTNISNRVSANMVVGSVSSALTNFIPITQSWGQVSPLSSLVAMKDTIQNTVRDDGMIAKSSFLTNRLMQAEKLYQTAWDKIIDKAGIMMEVVDGFTSQVVWRSKFRENIQAGMSENEAIHNADQFAENVIGGRSRGNMPTAFYSKNPMTKMLTAFQLEVNNQYGYMFKDMPQDVKAKHRLITGYAGMFIGAYVYNALYSSLTGRDAAFDPIGIIMDVLKDLGMGDDEEEEKDVVGAVEGLAENIVDELPFVGGLFGGGRMPISSAIPYDDPVSMVTGTWSDAVKVWQGISGGEEYAAYEKNIKNLTSEWLNPVAYLALPAGGGQIRKAMQGLSMFNDTHPVSGSYTNSGALRFPVEDTLENRIQTGIFGQYASKNAREYFDNEYAPLEEKQIQEYVDLDIPIAEYRKYREGLKEQKKVEDKFEYINDLDYPVSKKNIMINNAVKRKEKVDMSNYDAFGSYEEFDFYLKNKDKHKFLQENGISYEEYTSSDETREAYNTGFRNPDKFKVYHSVFGDYVAYRRYAKKLSKLEADKDENGETISGSRKEKVINYINALDMDYGEKIILLKSEYPSDDTYNYDIIEYLNNREDITREEMVGILTELDFYVTEDGKVTWE